MNKNTTKAHAILARALGHRHSAEQFTAMLPRAARTRFAAEVHQLNQAHAQGLAPAKHELHQAQQVTLAAYIVALQASRCVDHVSEAHGDYGDACAKAIRAYQAVEFPAIDVYSRALAEAFVQVVLALSPGAP